MDRQERLAERQAAVVSIYDAEAPAYDEHDYPSDVQREWVARALAVIDEGLKWEDGWGYRHFLPR